MKIERMLEFKLVFFFFCLWEQKPTLQRGEGMEKFIAIVAAGFSLRSRLFSDSTCAPSFTLEIAVSLCHCQHCYLFCPG